MVRLLLQLGGCGLTLCLALLLIINTRPTESMAVTQLQLPTAQEAIGTSVDFPYSIAGTALTVEALTPYDGHYMEDGTDRQVCNVAAVVLRNSGPAITWLQITVETAAGTLTFTANTVPADSTLIVLEQRAKQYPPQQPTACSGQVLTAEELWLEEGALRFEAVDMGTLAVTNLTDQPAENLRIYYKTYYPEDNIFLGGVTYCTVLEQLQPGETLPVTPSHFAQGYSRIVKVSMTRRDSSL